MSKIEELIARLCPDGVEYKAIGEVSSFRRGSFPQPYGNREWYDGEGAMPFVQVADIGNDMRLVDDTKRKISVIAQPKSVFAPKGSIVISIQGSIGRIAITQYDAYIDRTVAIFKNIDKSVLPKYFVYQIQRVFEIKEKTARGSTIKTITKEEFTNYKFPVPPLEVQREIVHILDSFTLLTAELAVELAARQKQYEFYRDMLLTFDDVRAGGTSSIPFCFLSDIADFRNGKGHEQNMVPDGKYIVVNSKFISTNGDVKKYSNDQICPLFKDDILMVMSDLPNGRALAKCYLTESDNKYTLNQRIGAIKTKDSKNVMTKYLFYILNRNKQLLKFDNGVDQTNLKKSDILHIKIPVPPLSEQQRIVDILDRFDALCNDITSGLPAEIEARKKQYEYYRDKLLTFKELKKEA